MCSSDLSQKSDGQGRFRILDFGLRIGLRGARGVEVRGDFGAVGVVLRRAYHGGDGKLDSGHVAEEFLDLTAFPCELFRVFKILILASAAASEERAARGDAVRRCSEDFHEVGLGVVFVIAENAGAHAFAGKRKWNHHDPTIFRIRRVTGERDASKSDAAIGQRVDVEFDFLVIAEGMVVEAFFCHGSGIIAFQIIVSRRDAEPQRVDKTKQVKCAET